MFEFGAGHFGCNRSKGASLRVQSCLSLQLVIFGVIGPRSFVEVSRLFEFGAGHFWCNRSEGIR